MRRRSAAAAAVVAQNDQDLAAERGLSSFDQRHRFTGDFTYQLPFGADQRWFNTAAGGRAPRRLADQRQRAARVGHAVHCERPRRASATSAAARTARCAPTTTAQPITVSDPTALLLLQHRRVLGSGARHLRQRRTQHDHRPRHVGAQPGLTRNIKLRPDARLSLQVLANNVLTPCSSPRSTRWSIRRPSAK